MSLRDPGAGGWWRLHRRVALRPEPFGALAYHYDTRTLNFLRSPELVRLVRSLEDHSSPRAAFDAVGVPEQRWPAFASALRALALSGFIEPWDPTGPPNADSAAVDASDTKSVSTTGVASR